MEDTDSLDSYGYSSVSVPVSYNYASFEDTRSTVSEFDPESNHDSQSVFSDRSVSTDNSRYVQFSSGAPSVRSVSPRSTSGLSMHSDHSNNSNNTVRDSVSSEPSQNRRLWDALLVNVQENRAYREASVEIFSGESGSAPGTSGSGESPTRNDTDSPPLKIQKLKSGSDVSGQPPREAEQEGDGETCSICLDAWSNSGEHRLVALKCGHLFGHNCVLRWLKTQSAKDKCCPTCKTRASVRDIRFIYARKLVAVDRSELETLKHQLERCVEEKIIAEGRLSKSMLLQTMCMDQIRDLKNRIILLESRSLDDGQITQATLTHKVRWRFALDKTIEVSKDNGCRVLAYNCRKYELCVSQKSTNGLFPGYGIRKINCIDNKLGQFVFLHPKEIRDLKYSQPNDLLLSVSLDKTAKLFSGQSNVVTHTIPTETPLWSCCWDLVSGHRFIVGGVGGTTMIYDIRQTGAALERFSSSSGDSPVVSVASTPQGFLACQLTSCWFYHRQDTTHTALALPFEGPFLSLSYEEQSKQILVSCRPTLNKCAQHVVGYLSFDDSVDCNLVHMFSGSSVQTLMSRSCQIRLGSENLVAAHNESGGAVSVYSVNGFATSQSLPTQEPVVDICTMCFNGTDYLATLSQSKTRIYKATNCF